MGRPRARSASDGAWSLAQIAEAAGVSYRIARTAHRLGQIDAAALTWHDVLAVRAVDELGGNPSSNRSDGRIPDRVRARLDRNRAVATAIRTALRSRYKSGIPPVGAVDDLWLLVGAGAPEPIEDLYGISKKIAEAKSTVWILPLSRWVGALAAEIVGQPDAVDPAPQGAHRTSELSVLRTGRTSAPPVTMTAMLELDETLYFAALSAAETMSRSPAQQMVHWARIGRRIDDDPEWSARDVAALLQGRTRAVVEPNHDAAGP